MSRIGRWLDRGRAKATGSSTSLNLTTEAENMDLALKAAEKIMDDDIKGAEEALATGDSAFHKLARGTLGFMKATLGFEQEVMKEASDLLGEAENSAYNYHYQAQHDPSAYTSAIYEKGSEFALCQAEAQIMSAIVGVLNESLTESIKGFYKMRKAYMTLDSLIQMERNYIKTRGVKSLTTSRAESRESLQSTGSAKSSKSAPGQLSKTGAPPAKPSALRQAESAEDQDDSDADDFFEVDEVKEKNPVTETYEGHVERPDSSHMAVKEVLTKDMSTLDIDQRSDLSDELSQRPELLKRTSKTLIKLGMISANVDDEFFTSSLDIFIHSGTNLMFGIISLMISIIPPAFARILAIVGFRGDREKGMRMLWQASKFPNVNGGMAALVLFGWYNGIIGFCDIITDSDPSTPANEQVEGYPIQRLQSLLEVMRARYPKSHLWMIEEARMTAARRNLGGALDLLSKAGKSDLKQLQALQVFEKALDAMNSHNYDLCAQSFLACVDLNGWSQTLYYYITGSAHLTKARDLEAAGNQDLASKHFKAAEDNLRKAPNFVGKKKMMGRQLPFDSFVQRKVNKWTERASARKCSFVDAIGVCPLEEMIFLWNGYKKMNETQLQKSLDNLAWSEKSSHWSNEALDERCVHALLRATILRNLRKHKEAKEILRQDIFPHDKSVFAGHNMDNWAPPAALYEFAVNSWQQRREFVRRYGAMLAGPVSNAEEPPELDIKADAALVAEAKQYCEKAKNWGSYELDARIGMKVTAALGAIAKWEKRHPDVAR